MSESEFDLWMLKRAREKPNNPIYAHLQTRVAMVDGNSAVLKALPSTPDLKSKAAGDHVGDDTEMVDERNDCEIIEGEG